ncbi:MAG: hypothetical protein Q7K43_04765 [Candidatus Woesearchaeota archaeon]|nr:hypothetical protein [Candidatus Woesearchaeota archaeon]
MSLSESLKNIPLYSALRLIEYNLDDLAESCARYPMTNLPLGKSISEQEFAELRTIDKLVVGNLIKELVEHYEENSLLRDSARGRATIKEVVSKLYKRHNLGYVFTPAELVPLTELMNHNLDKPEQNWRKYSLPIAIVGGGIGTGIALASSLPLMPSGLGLGLIAYLSLGFIRIVQWFDDSGYKKSRIKAATYLDKKLESLIDLPRTEPVKFISEIEDVMFAK